MTWTPALFSPGDTLTAEEVNTLLSGPYYYVSANSNQSISNNADTPLSFNTVTEYNNRYASVSTPATGVAVPISGVYVITGQATFATNASGYRQVYIDVGGTGVKGVNQPAFSGPSWVGSVSTLKKISAGTKVALRVYQNSGGSLNTDSTALGGCSLSLRWLGLA